MKKKNITTSMIAQGGSGRPTTQADSTLGIVVTARKWPKTVAHATIIKIMQVVSVDE